MNVNKKFDRLRQWGREKMGGDVRTDTTDEFKSLQVEMDLRHDGMERLKKSMASYIKWLSKREQTDDKDKQAPVGFMGATMARHGGDFETESDFGQCLSSLGRANERISRMQETYCANATNCWLESTERSLVQMKDYQDARKRLDQRRLAYDTALRTIEKSKREDSRLEEQLRAQKQKYEESSDEVSRRMMDIKGAEAESLADLTSFLEAELAYYERCKEVLLQVKRDWPTPTTGMDRSTAESPMENLSRQETRSRASSLMDRFSRIGDDESSVSNRPAIGTRIQSEQFASYRERPGLDYGRAMGNRSVSGFEGPTTISQNSSITSGMPTEPSTLTPALSNLRIQKRETNGNVFADDQSDGSEMSQVSRVPSWSAQGHDGTAAKKVAPPPPPSRSKKPPLPPPPMKRMAASSSAVPQY